ncbi:hypothetical protein ACFL27_17645 [candidate division CSSED10-310 bacterium]|uniref:Uncharacterized protein n=1 Tax=candidate division CSSED10-310 bacterium TaxID=2855610 RepID=A0ABV6Z0P9_UNCC1
MNEIAELPVVLQFSLSDWMDELIRENQDQHIEKPEITEQIAVVLTDFSKSYTEVINLIKSEPMPNGAPFHAVIGPEGLQLRSNEDHTEFSDESLIHFKWELTQIPSWAEVIQQVLRSKYGVINMSTQSLGNAINDFLSAMSQQFSLTCIFPVPPPNGKSHDNSAVFELKNYQIRAQCESKENHVVYFMD